MATIDDRLARLSELPANLLRMEWRRHFPGEPPARLSRDLLRRAIAYQMQERAYGGLSQAARKRLRELADKIVTPESRGRVRAVTPTLTPGVRLVRDWHGQAHTVLVLDDGFEYRGQRYRSLTEIARGISGAHWSGPRFFGVGPARKTLNPATPRQGPSTARDERAERPI